MAKKPNPWSERAKLGELMAESNNGPVDEETNSSTESGTPPRLSMETISPWSPYVKSPWTKLSPSPYDDDHRRRRRRGGCSSNYTLLGSLLREEGHVYSVASSGEFLYTGSDSRSIRVWSKNPLRDSGGFKSGSGLVKAIIVTADGRVFTGHQDGKIRVWKKTDYSNSHVLHKRVGSLPTWKDYLKSYVEEVRRDRRRVPRAKHLDAVSCLVVNVEEGLLYSGSWDKTVKVWRLSDGRCLDSFLAHDDAVNALALAFGGLLFSASADGTLKVWRREVEVEGKRSRHVYVQTVVEQASAITSLAEEEGVLYSGSSDGLVSFWEWKKHLINYGGVLRGHKLAVLCLASAGSLVFSGSADNSICVWRREAGGIHVCLAVLTGHTGPVKCLAVELEEEALNHDHDPDKDPEEVGDRRWIVYSGSLDNSVKIWRVFENAKAR